MDSANNVAWKNTNIPEWVNEVRLPVLKKLLTTIFEAHYGNPVCLEDLGYSAKEVTLTDLGYSNFCIYYPMETFYQQGIQPLKNMDPVSVHCNVYSDGEIIMFARVWKYDYNSKSRYAQPKGSKDRNDMIIRAFRIKACEHKYVITHSRMCYREYRCEMCGHEYSEDSSD